MKERKPISRREVDGDFRIDLHKRENGEWLLTVQDGSDCIMRAYKRYGCALKKYWFLSEKHKEMRTGSWCEITSR